MNSTNEQNQSSEPNLNWVKCKQCGEDWSRISGDVCSDCEKANKKAQLKHDCTFENFECSEINKPIVNKLKNFLDLEHGIYLYGKPGTGKTHLAKAVFYMLKDKNRSVGFFKIPEIIVNLRSVFKNQSQTTETEIINEVISPRTIILDDLGAENTTGYSREALYLIFDKISEMPDKKLIITSNMPLSEIEKDLNDRICSRIAGMCELIRLHGQDYRLKKQS